MNRPMSEIIKRQAPLVLPQTTTVSDACRLMRERKVGAALVTGGDDGRRLVGIFTGRDAVCRVLAEGKPAATTELSEVMTRDPEAMPPEGMATEALRLMRDCGFRHVPVVDRGRAVGVVSRSDFLGLEQARLDDEAALREHN